MGSCWSAHISLAVSSDCGLACLGRRFLIRPLVPVLRFLCWGIIGGDGYGWEELAGAIGEYSSIGREVIMEWRNCFLQALR